MRFAIPVAAAALLATSLFTPSAAALGRGPVIVDAGGVVRDDASDAVPSLDQIRAALIVMGAPTINELEMLDSAPLADRFDESSRFVAAPTSDSNEVTMNVGAYVVEDGKDERAEFQSAYAALQTWAQRRGGKGGFQATTADTGFGASEGYDGVLISEEGGQDKNLLVVRLSRFDKTITMVATDTDVKTSPVPELQKEAMILVNVVVSKVVADNTK